MARIKYVLNERRLAYAGALDIQAEERWKSVVTKEEKEGRKEFEREALAQALRRREEREAKAAEEAAASSASA
jgi:hypothetical protein